MKKLTLVLLTVLLFLGTFIPDFVFAEDQDVYSVEEHAYMQAAAPLKVAIVSDWMPFQYMDDDGQYKGIHLDILQKIADITGLTFDYVPTDSYRDAIEAVQSGQADIAAGVPVDDESVMSDDLSLTTPYLSYAKVKITNKESALNDTRDTLAVFPNSEYLWGDYDSLKNYDSFEESLEAVNEGHADFTYGDWYSVEYYLANHVYKNISVKAARSSTENISFALNSQQDPRLLTIMNKAVEGLSYDEISTIVLDNSLMWEKEVSLSSWIESNPLIALLLLGGVIMVIISAMILYLSMRISHNKKIYELANTDKLTGARNFARFQIDAAKLLMSNDSYVVSYSDIKMFRYINDRFGYEEGDKVLKKFAQLLESDLLPGEIFCRVNADTFVSLRRYDTRENLIKRQENFSEKLAKIKIEGDPSYQMKLCTGFFHNDNLDQTFTIMEMIDRANLAQKSVKRLGRAGYAFYEDEIRDQMIREQEIEGKMHQALANGEFAVYLQPKCELKSFKPCSAEALVRWVTPEGIIPPSQYISLFERNFFILELDKYIFEECCKLIRYWLDNDMPVVPIAVNVSRVHFAFDSFVQVYAELKEKYQIPDGYLELEFTESTVFHDNKRIVDIVNKLREYGFTCAIDDFGVGYSSLTALKNIPVDCLKADAQFFADGHDRHKDRVMIESVMSIGKSLEMKVVAEGIEEWDQVKYLKHVGCDMVQGYVFAKPMPVEQFEEYLAEKGA